MAGQLPPDDRLRRLRRVGAGVLVVAAAAACAVLALVLRPRAATSRYVIRPELSVQGVGTGSLVRLNGVVIGRVVRVALWSDPASGRARPEIAFALDPGRPPLRLPEAVAQGLRARCIPLNPASGFLEVDLVWSPGSPVLVATADADEIPWEASPQQLAAERAIAVVGQVAAVDLRQQAERLAAKLAEAEDRVVAGARTTAGLAERASRLRAAVGRVAEVAGPDRIGLVQARLGELREALRATDAALDAIDRDLRAWPGEAGEALREVSRVCRENAARLRREVPPEGAR